MNKLLFLLIPSLMAAQTLTLSSSATTVPPGGTFTVTVSYADSNPASGAIAAQYTLGTPAGFTAAQPTLITPGILDSFACDTPADSYFPNAQTCVLGGFGATLTGAALPIAALSIAITAGNTSGAQIMTLSNLSTVISTPGTGASLGIPQLTVGTLSAANALTITVSPSKYDLNGDGVVNGADVAVAVADWKAKSCPANFAAVGDGKCGLIDIEYVVLAALGLVH